jgi:hypothetical protein
MRAVDMVNQAAKALGKDGRVFSNEEIRDWIEERWTGTNPTTLNCTLLLCAVNAQSRLSYPENQKIRVKRHDDYDTIFRVGRAKYVLYHPETHGLWGILNVDGKLQVTCIKKPKSDADHGETEDLSPREEAETLQNDVRALQQQLGAFIADGGDPTSDSVRDLRRDIEWKRIRLDVVEGRRPSTLTNGEISLLKQMVGAFIEKRRELVLVSEDGNSAQELTEDEERAWLLAKRLWV